MQDLKATLMDLSDENGMTDLAHVQSIEAVTDAPDLINQPQCQVIELQKHLADAESTRFGLDRQLSLICRQMTNDSLPDSHTHSDQSERVTFQLAIEAQLQDTGDPTYAAVQGADGSSSMLVDDVLEAKYNSLKSRYRKMEDNYRHEVDNLHEEIAVLQARMKALDVARAQAQSNEVMLAETLEKTTSQVSNELMELCCENHALSCENHDLCKELINAKLALAQCAERELIRRRDVYKARQTNAALAAKFAKLEGLLLEIVDST